MSLEQVLATVKRTSGGAINADAPLMESGVDSLGAVELRNQLQGIAGQSVVLPSTLIFDHPTARQLAVLLQPAKEAPDELEFDAPSDVQVGALRSAVNGGTDALLPNGAASMKRVWWMAATGLSVITEAPVDALDSRILASAF